MIEIKYSFAFIMVTIDLPLMCLVRERSPNVCLNIETSLDIYDTSITSLDIYETSITICFTLFSSSVSLLHPPPLPPPPRVNRCTKFLFTLFLRFVSVHHLRNETLKIPRKS